MTELSIVLISKNQVWNISRLIESILKEAECVASHEIILVDSASTDETVEVASRYPVNILRLRPGQKVSPAIGRYVGYQRTQGEFVLFLDGDTQLVPGWLALAFRVMREIPNAGAVTGRVINLPTSAAKVHGEAPIPAALTSPSREVRWGSYGGGGAAMYRRSVLERVGTFNPNLNADEEPELGFRIRQAGYMILELDYPIVRHYNDAPVALSSMLNRRKRNFHLGSGQSARGHLGSKLFWPWIIERPWGLAPALLLALGVGSLLMGLLTGHFVWLGLWSLGISLLIAYVSYRKRSVRGALVAAFNWLLLAEGFVKGFLMKPVPPEKFHMEVEEIVERHPNERGSTPHFSETPEPRFQYSPD